MFHFTLLIALLGLAQSATYYGRAFGAASSWTRLDKGTSHHLEVSFKPMPGYSKFTANVDIRSKDGSSLHVAVLPEASLQPILSLVRNLNNTGVQKLSTGITYCHWLTASQFTVTDEDHYTSLLETYLKGSRFVYFFGQVYADSDGTNGIHDIHRIPNYPGDGAFIAQDTSGKYMGIFSYFNDQSVC